MPGCQRIHKYSHYLLTDKLGKVGKLSFRIGNPRPKSSPSTLLIAPIKGSINGHPQ